MSITHQTMELVLTHIEHVLQQAKIDNAPQLAEQILTHLRKKFGSSEIYFPVHDIEQRNTAIKVDFNGRNHAEICRKYHISLRTLYRILK